MERVDIGRLEYYAFVRFSGRQYEPDERVVRALKKKDPNLDVYFDRFSKMFVIFRYAPQYGGIFDIVHIPVNRFGMWIVDKIQENNESPKEFKQRRSKERDVEAEQVERQTAGRFAKIIQQDRKVWEEYYDEYLNVTNPHKRGNQSKDWYKMATTRPNIPQQGAVGARVSIDDREDIC